MRSLPARRENTPTLAQAPLQPLLIASLVFACAFGAAIAGQTLRARLPSEHVSSDARDVVKLGIGLVATLTALVLGLVTASAKSQFDLQDSAVKTSAANLVLLDRTLARYGPETRPIRDLLRVTVAHRLAVTWPDDGAVARTSLDESTAPVDEIQDQILALAPHTDAQRWLQSRALGLSDTLAQERWLSSTGAASSIPLPFLVALTVWLTAIFGTFGVLAPRNPTVLVVLLVSTLAVATSLFLILEMESPFGGLMRISSGPLRFALAHLGS